MINAKQAREKTESSRLSLTKASVEKAIKKAIEQGRDYILFLSPINKELEDELKENGFKVEQQASGKKISW